LGTFSGTLRRSQRRSTALSAAFDGALSGVRRRGRALGGTRPRSAALVEAFPMHSKAPEKRFFLAMGENGPYSETSFYL
jgi:hypothetical protein